MLMATDAKNGRRNPARLPSTSESRGDSRPRLSESRRDSRPRPGPPARPLLACWGGRLSGRAKLGSLRCLALGFHLLLHVHLDLLGLGFRLFAQADLQHALVVA